MWEDSPFFLEDSEATEPCEIKKTLDMILSEVAFFSVAVTSHMGY